VKTELKDRIRLIEEFYPQIVFLSRVKTLTADETNHKFKSPLCVKYEGMEVFFDLSGLIDFEQEAKRVNSEINRIKREIEILSKKLMDKNFRENAPEEIVQEKKEELSSLKEKEANLNESLKRLISSNRDAAG